MVTDMTKLSLVSLSGLLFRVIMRIMPNYYILDEEIPPVIECETVTQRARMTGNYCIQDNICKSHEHCFGLTVLKMLNYDTQ